MEHCREAVGSYLGGIRCSTGFRVSEADFSGDRERSGVVLPPLGGRAAWHVGTSADLQGQDSRHMSDPKVGCGTGHPAGVSSENQSQ